MSFDPRCHIHQPRHLSPQSTGEQYDDDYTLFTQNYGERLDLEKLGARNTWPVSPAKSSKVVGAFTFLAAAALLAV